MTTAKFCLLAGTIAALTGVMLGAFGAHALRRAVSPDMLAIWHTGVEYQFYHALGLLTMGVLATQIGGKTWLRVSGWLLVAGIILFSGSLYLLVLSGQRWLGAITPLGGTAFIAGWATLAIGVWRVL